MHGSGPRGLHRSGLDHVLPLSVATLGEMTLDADLHALATAANFAALTTLGADGSPSTQMMWVHADDDCLLINTEVERNKFRNLSRDPRVTVLVFDAASPYRYVEARGRVVDTVVGDAARAQLDELAHKYTDAPYANPVGSDRVIVRIRPERIVKKL